METSEEWFKAIIEKDNKKIDELISSGIDINIQNEDENTALILSVDNILGYNSSIFNKMLSLGADANIHNGSGYTALHNACFIKNTSCIKKLIKAGADVNLPHHYYGHSLMISIYVNDYEASKILIKAGSELDIKNHNGQDFYNCLKSKRMVRRMVNDLAFQRSLPEDILLKLSKYNLINKNIKIQKVELFKAYGWGLI